MPTDAEITFADHMGRFYARRYAFPPMVGRLIGYLAVCDPPEQTHRRARRGAAGQPQRDHRRVKALETMHSPPLASRRRADGPRAARHELAGARRASTSPNTRSWATSRARVSRCCDDAPPERRAVLLEMAAFADFLVEQIPRCAEEWADAARGAGRLRVSFRSEPEHGSGGDERRRRSRRSPRRGLRKSFGNGRCSTASTRRSPRARSSRCSGPTAPARRRSCASSSTLIAADAGRGAGGRP